MRPASFLLLLLPLSLGTAFATVNLNTAQQSELERTQGLDKLKAKAIIEYRAQHGPFTSVDELERVPGFNRAVVDNLKTQVGLSGDAYVAPKAESRSESRPKKK